MHIFFAHVHQKPALFLGRKFSQSAWVGVCLIELLSPGKPEVFHNLYIEMAENEWGGEITLLIGVVSPHLQLVGADLVGNINLCETIAASAEKAKFRKNIR